MSTRSSMVLTLWGVGQNCKPLDVMLSSASDRWWVEEVDHNIGGSPLRAKHRYGERLIRLMVRICLDHEGRGWRLSCLLRWIEGMVRWLSILLWLIVLIVDKFVKGLERLFLLFSSIGCIWHLRLCCHGVSSWPVDPWCKKHTSINIVKNNC